MVTEIRQYLIAEKISRKAEKKKILRKIPIGKSWGGCFGELTA